MNKPSDYLVYASNFADTTVVVMPVTAAARANHPGVIGLNVIKSYLPAFVTNLKINGFTVDVN